MTPQQRRAMEARKKIAKAVRDRPSNIPSLAAALDMTVPVTVSRLKWLEEHGYVRVVGTTWSITERGSVWLEPPPKKAPDTAPLGVPAIRDLLSRHKLWHVAERVCRDYGVTSAELLGRIRSQHISTARHALYHGILNMPGRNYSATEVGRLLGRDHTSIIYGANKHQRLLKDIKKLESEAA